MSSPSRPVEQGISIAELADDQQTDLKALSTEVKHPRKGSCLEQRLHARARRFKQF